MLIQVRQSFLNEKRSLLLFIAAMAAALSAIFLFALTKSPMFGLAFVIALIGGLLVLRWPGIGIGVLTFLLPLERMQRFTDDNTAFTISIMRFVALAALGAIVLHRLAKKQSIALDPTMFIYGGYALLAFASLFYTSDPAGAKRAIGTIGANCIFFFIYLNYFHKRSQIYAMLAIWLAANVLAISYSAYDWHLGSGRTGGVVMEADPGKGAQTTENRWSTIWQDRAEYESLGGMSLRRSMGPTSHAAVYGINMVMTMPFFILLLAFCQNNLWKYAGLVVILALLAYNLMLTNTRAVLLQAGITAVACVIAGLYRIKTQHVLLGLIGGAVLLSVMPKDIFNRILDPTNYDLNKSAAMRVRISYWKAGMSILEQHWLLGMGVGNEQEIPKYVQGKSAEKTTVHNTFLQYLLELGIVGWTLFYGFVGSMFYCAHRAGKYFLKKPGWELDGKILVGIQVAMFSVLVFGVQVDVFLFPLKGWWLLSIIGLVYYRWYRTMEREEARSAS